MHSRHDDTPPADASPGEESRAADPVAATLRQIVSARDEVIFAYMFGSQARDDATHGKSDVDVGVYLDLTDRGERFRGILANLRGSEGLLDVAPLSRTPR